jgi:FtsP/CotA-like multicopper oxidase with cupredoxin domain
MGLYGNIVVVPSEPDYWPPVHRELTLTLDDILLEEGQIAPFSRLHPNYTAMGRYGNALLVNGEPRLSTPARLGEVVRFYLTNTANTRVFNLRLGGARMKLVGGDSGRYERETFVDHVVIAPSERVVLDVLFDRPGEVTLEHRTPARVYPLVDISVQPERAEPALAARFEDLRESSEMIGARARIAGYLTSEPDKTLALVAEMNMGDASHGDEEHHHGHPNEQDGIEWEDDMVEMNRRTNPANMRWMLIDRQTGAVGGGIDWRFRVRQQVKIRIVNEMDSDHPMYHPFHIHGAGRFLILSRNGVEEPNLVWKDTVLIRTGETVDILLDVTHPGVWMAHCHIAEHHESGMMLTFRVEP